MAPRKPRSIRRSTAAYEAWLGARLRLLPADLAAKHEAMREDRFAFLRATYYRWAERWPSVCPGCARAPAVLAVGDLHVENFGTWRDAEARLVWGINDFDEAARLPYTHDLVRLAASAHVAIAGDHLGLAARAADAAIAAGYRDALAAGGRPLVLAEHSAALREMAVARLRDPAAFWRKLSAAKPREDGGEPPAGVVRTLAKMLPAGSSGVRVAHRVAGLGSLGRARWVALAEWHGALVAREAKALAPSAALWARRGGGAGGDEEIRYQEALDGAVRCPDPQVRVKRRWIVRRLAPDCSRIELSELPRERDEERLLHAMGWETANVHLGSRKARSLLADLGNREGREARGRKGGWLHDAARRMVDALEEDWRSFRKG